MPIYLLPAKKGIFEIHLWKIINPKTNDLEMILHSVILVNDPELKKKTLSKLSSLDDVKKYIFTRVDGDRLFSNAEQQLREIKLLYNAANHYHQ